MLKNFIINALKIGFKNSRFQLLIAIKAMARNEMTDA